MAIHNFRNYNRTHLSLETSDLFNPVNFVAECNLSKEAYRDSLDESFALQTALEEINAMETLYDTLNRSETGLSKPATALAVISVESICRKLGVSSTYLMPSMESMESSYGVRLALEGIGSKLKELWQKFWGFIKGIFSKIASFFSSEEREIKQEKAEKKVEVLEEKLEEVTHENPNATPQEQTIESPPIADYLHADDGDVKIEGYPAVERISNDIESFSEFAFKYNEYVLKHIKDLNTNLSKVINVLSGASGGLTEENKSDFDDILTEIHRNKMSYINATLKKFIDNSYFLGNASLSITLDEDGDVNITPLDAGHTDTQGEGSVKTLTLKELKAVVSLLEHNVGLNKKFIKEGPAKAKSIEAGFDSFNKSVEKLISIFDKLEHTSTSGDNDESPTDNIPFGKIKMVVAYAKNSVASLVATAKYVQLVPTKAVEHYSVVVSEYANKSLDSFMTE